MAQSPRGGTNQQIQRLIKDWGGKGEMQMLNKNENTAWSRTVLTQRVMEANGGGCLTAQGSTRAEHVLSHQLPQ